MNERIAASLEAHRQVANELAQECAGRIEEAARRVVGCYRAGGKVLAFGNGGSAADAQHFVAELVGRYQLERAALPAIALTTDTSILTAVANDYGYDDVFKRQVEAHARPGDIVVGISTSGNSESVLRALRRARELRAVTIGLSGGSGGKLTSAVDLAILVPSTQTARIQEGHITIIHILCEVVEAELARDDAR
jgi:D-sedoheptulose 7-phosphate isomerase